MFSSSYVKLERDKLGIGTSFLISFTGPHRTSVSRFWETSTNVASFFTRFQQLHNTSLFLTRSAQLPHPARVSCNHCCVKGMNTFSAANTFSGGCRSRFLCEAESITYSLHHPLSHDILFSTWHVLPASGLILQLLCSPIGQWYQLGMEYGFWKTGFTRLLEPDNAKNRFWSPKNTVLRFENTKTAHLGPKSRYL